MNTYFTNIEKQFQDTVKETIQIPKMEHYTLNSFVLTDITEDELKIEVLKLKDKYTSPDTINNTILKVNVNILSKPLTILFNQCIEKEIFPESLKTALVTPIYKGGDRSNLSNYRPI